MPRPRPLPAAPSFAALLLSAGAAVGWAQFGPARGPVPPPGEEGAGGPGADPAPRLFHADRAAERRVTLARRTLAAGNAAEAVELALLALRDGTDAALADGTPARVAAAELLTGLSPRDRRTLELRAGPEATAAFEDAAGRGDAGGLARAAARFPGTAGGTRAAARLADLHLDRGEYAAAARRFDALSRLPFPPARDRARWRLKTAAALLGAGERAAAADRLAAVPPGERAAFLTDRLAGAAGAPDPADDAAVLAALGPRVLEPRPGPDDWRRVGRLPGRAAARPGVTPPAAVSTVGGPAWRASTRGVLPPTDAEGPAKGYADLTRRVRAASDESLWPAARPLLAAGVPGRDDAGAAVFFTTPAGVVAADAATGAVRWESAPLPDSEYARVTGADEDPTLTDRSRGTVTGTRNLYEERAYRDAASGTLSADGRHVYAVRNGDLPKWDAAGGAGPGNGPFLMHSRRPRANRLIAYDRVTGRTVWTAGGPSGWGPLAVPGPAASDSGEGYQMDSGAAPASGNPAGDTFFCGPPLPTPHGLAVLGETGGVLRLFVLDPADGAVRRVLPLAVPPLPRYEPPRWRVAGLGVAAGAGLWVVPTAAGGVAAVDPLTGNFAWTYRYETSVQTEGGPEFVRGLSRTASVDDQRRWADAPPKLAAGRVLLTPRDSEQLHCLDLATGERLWVRPRGSGRQVAAVVAGEGDDAPAALLACDDGVRAVSLADGAERWFTPLPPPAGDAVPAGDLLIVPLSDDTLAAVRTDGGGVTSRLPAGGAAGNLIAAGGRMVSQGPDGVAAWRTRSETAARIDAALAAAESNPAADAADPEALLLRAGLALEGGRDADAVADLIAAASLPTPAGGRGVEVREAVGRARERLSEVLADGLRREFDTFAPLLTDAAPALGDPPAGEVARAYADGLTRAGDRGAAFRVLARAADGPARPAVTAAAWARPRLADLFAAADAEQREPMIAEVRAAFDAAADAEGAPARVAGLEAFAQRFGRLCGGAAWRAAVEPPAGAVDLVDVALRRAAEIAGANPKAAPIVPERLLRWAASRPGAAPADAGLADLAEAAGDNLAAAHLRGEAGADPPPFAGRRVVAAEAADRGRVPAKIRVPVAAFPPWAPGGRLTVDNVGPGLRWQADDGRTRFTHVLPGRVQVRGLVARWDGHLLALGLRDRVWVLDTLTRPGRARPLWDLALPNGPASGQSAVRADRTPDSPGAAGREFDGPCLLSPRQIVVRAGSRLAAADPLTGAFLWRRGGVPPLARVIGDDRVILLLPEGVDEATVLRADDGARLGTVPAPPRRDRWLERGTRVWTTAPVPDARPGGGSLAAVACTDLAPDGGDADGLEEPREVWSREFPRGTLFRPDDAAAFLTAVTPGRRAFVIDLATGEDRAAADLGPGPQPTAAWGLRAPGGWTVLTASGGAERQEWRFGRRAVDRGEVSAYGLVAGRGEPVWSRPVSGPPDADGWQPPGLPVLAQGGVAGAGPDEPAYRRRFTLTLYDRRNGAELFTTANLAPLTPFEWEIGPAGPWARNDSGNGPVRLRTRGADLSLTLSDGPPAEPLRDPPASADDPPEEGS